MGRHESSNEYVVGSIHSVFTGTVEMQWDGILPAGWIESRMGEMGASERQSADAHFFITVIIRKFSANRARFPAKEGKTLRKVAKEGDET